MLFRSPTTEVTVDLEAQAVTAEPVAERFEMDPHTRWRLLQGLDDIGLTLRHADEIAAYERTRAPWMPAAG